MRRAARRSPRRSSKRPGHLNRVTTHSARHAPFRSKRRTKGLRAALARGRPRVGASGTRLVAHRAQLAACARRRHGLVVSRRAFAAPRAVLLPGVVVPRAAPIALKTRKLSALLPGWISSKKLSHLWLHRVNWNADLLFYCVQKTWSVLRVPWY